MNREYRIRYDREHDKFVRNGEGVFSDMVQNIASKLFSGTVKSTVKTAKTGDYAAKKAGNKII